MKSILQHRSSNLNHLDVIVWDHLKLVVYQTLVDTPEDILAWIVVAAANTDATPDIIERVWKYFIRCCRLTNDVRVRHYEEHL